MFTHLPDIDPSVEYCWDDTDFGQREFDLFGEDEQSSCYSEPPVERVLQSTERPRSDGFTDFPIQGFVEVAMLPVRFS